MGKKPSILIIVFFLSFLLPLGAFAQSFEAGLKLYGQQNYEQASSVFTKINTPEAKLFAGKSYYALGRLNDANAILNELLNNTKAPGIYYEAAYTSAIVDFQQKQFSKALVKLYSVIENASLQSLTREAENFYAQILGYLSVEQRVNALNNINSNQIKYDLVETAAGKIPFTSLKNLIAQFYDSVDEKEWISKVQNIESNLTNEPAYKVEYGNKINALSPPEGTIYEIGVLLPKFDTEEPTYAVTQGLYLGAQLAANQFNRQHSKVKVYLSFLPGNSGGLDNIVNNYVREDGGDIIIGPLFSDQAEELVSISTENKIPVIAPLATSNLDSKNSFLFQANSNAAIHGETMAKFAINQLGYNTFAVIAENSTSGENSATAFRKTAQELGAQIVSFQIKDFKKTKYDISSYLKESKPVFQKIDAVYAPLTSDYTDYLLEQLTNSINTLPNPVTLLGSPKWGSIDFSTDVYARGDIFYTVNSFQNRRLNEFQNLYRRIYGLSPNKYAAIGFDITNYLLQLLDQIGNPALLNNAMPKADFYKGLIKSIHFDGGHVNKAVQILKVGSGGRSILQSRNQ